MEDENEDGQLETDSLLMITRYTSRFVSQRRTLTDRTLSRFMAPSLLLKHNVSNDHLFDGLAPASTSRSRSYIGSPWNSLWKSRQVE